MSKKLVALLAVSLGFIPLFAWHEVDLPTASSKAVSFVAPRSASDTRLMFRYGLTEAPAADFRCELRKGGVLVENVMRSGRAGYVEYNGLTPDTEYTFHLVTDCATYNTSARTLPQITGKKLFSFAVVSDQHTSFTETAGARLFLYSREILEDTVKIANEAGCIAYVCPGDIVDARKPEEFAVAIATLKKFKGTLMNATGNHDVGAAGQADYKQLFGDGTGLRVIKGVQFAWINTGKGLLCTASNQKIFQRLNANLPTVFFSHYQLTPDDFIIDDDKCIHDSAKGKKYLDKLAKVKNAVIYIGHKNAPTQVTFAEKHHQMNCPQPSQFPCGMMIVDVYTTGLHQYYVPCASASMDELSRLSCAPTEARIFSRDSRTFSVCNQFFPMTISAK